MKHINALVNKHLRPISLRLRAKSATPPEPAEKVALLHRRPAPTVVSSVLDDVLQIPCPDPSEEDAARDAAFEQGQRMARQEHWPAFIRAVEEADGMHRMTPAGMPIADLLAFGARADVVHAAEHALMYGKPAKGAPLMAGIEAMEHLLAEHPGSYVMASLVAQAHMDMAWAWRGNSWDKDMAARNREAFEAHFDRAADILTPFYPDTQHSAFLMSACCALFSGTNQRGDRVSDRYETLIELNPANPGPMRAMGNHLLPRWHGSYAELEIQARRSASHTQKTWGAGGYTWVQFDAITTDDIACANLDVEFFTEGLRDILTRRPDPYTANLLAAYCANTIGQTVSANVEANEIRSTIGKCARWIVRDYLTELHPLIWAHAARGFDNNLRVASADRFAASGREDAMRLITSFFSTEIEAGKRIVFTDGGPVAKA